MIEIKLKGCLICLTETELRSILAKDTELWAKAIGRGKGVMRSRKNSERYKGGEYQ